MTDSPRKRPAGLGRGLSSLLGEVQQEASVAPGAEGTRGAVQMIPVAGIEPHPGQPRRIFQEEALAELALSIQARGVIQPIIARPLATVPGASPRFQIIAGERRWRAAQRAGLTKVPVVVKDIGGEERKRRLEMALIENIQRENLNPIEEAHAYHRLVTEFGLRHDDVAAQVGKDR